MSLIRQTLNVAGLARDAGVQRTTVNGYIEILEDTLVAYRIPGYEAKLRVKERKHPKLYWNDLGVLRAVAPQVGGPRVIAAAPEIMLALGLSLPDMTE